MSKRPPANMDGDVALLSLLRAIAAGHTPEVASLLAASPELATQALQVGASRQAAEPFFLERIGHYVYVGDTALHIAAGAYAAETARALIVGGGDVRARNRRGAAPLHHAAKGHPGSDAWDPVAQREVIEILVASGADPNGIDKSGVAPLHIAVRTRCSEAVRALLDCGADPMLPNGSGSTPLHLAVQNTGRGDTGAEASRQEQRAIILVLLDAGARPTDTNAAGKTVAASTTSAWVAELLDAHSSTEGEK
jgi:hypothetical protein